ncbi:UDP-N-acetyl-D-mannosamine dehydrogenase [Aeromicrobium panaciterrae]|uniref:UDP-N-acetyl-D-mannosamine dehydrogenase n=1 Tax=Aeromicrobium panaciterrae TaxID=363861 RepID=UPI0031D3F468
MKSRIAVIGLGYIGLPTATILAKNGQSVVGVDVSAPIVEAVSAGRLPFVEPDLADALADVVADGSLIATSEMPEAEVYILAVPTPFLADKSADMAYVESATRSIAAKLRGGELLILESTSPPGSTEQMGAWIADARPDLDLSTIDLAHCPERVLPGQIMAELVTNDRVVGGITPQAAERAADVYRTFCKGEILITDARTAEMAKLTENAFRDVNIAFANELSLICERLGVDVWELIELTNHHPRVNVLQPGPGVGGHCIAVDPWFIVAAAPEESKLISMARQVNDGKPEHVIHQVIDSVAGIANPRIATLGLAFKKNVDDLRGSPAIQITGDLARRLPDATVVAVEPHVDALPESLADLGVTLEMVDDALKGADAVVLLVDHDVFADLDRELLGTATVHDTRGLWKS